MVAIVAWVLGLAFIIFINRPAEIGDSEALGRWIGRSAFPVIVAALIWRFAVHGRNPNRDMKSPAVIGIAVCIAVVAKLGMVSQGA